MRRQFPIFTLFSVALYILIMSIHIAAKRGEIADKILLPGILFVRNLSLRTF